MYSIYHFFAHLYRNRNRLEWAPRLDDFPFDIELLSYKGKGRFPDFAIRVNPGGNPSGGELLEVKDSKSYSVPSFNSTIPTGTKSVAELIRGRRSVIRSQMEAAGDDIYSLPEREAYYLLRGKSKGNIKICLVHGSFFETVKVEQLIQQAFTQVLDERLAEEEYEISKELHAIMTRIFSTQDSFSRVRDVENATVKMRFRIMTEAKKEGNVFNSALYPKIKDNTLNFILPDYPIETISQRKQHLRQALAKTEWESREEASISHPFNGDFFVLSYSL